MMKEKRKGEETLYDIIFDLDDTLLNNQREVSEYTLDMLKRVQAMGHRLVCNTARSKSFQQKYFDQIRPDYAILNGGSMIIDRDENTIFRAEIDVPTTQALIRDLLALTDTVSVQTEDTFYAHKGWHTVQKAEPFDFEAEPFLLPAQKVVVAVQEEEQARGLAEKYGLAYTTYGEGPFRRYSHIGATKALGNRNLMKLIGGSLENVIAFGDDYGDMDMLKEAGVGVLMKNARAVLHGQTSHMSDYTNDEDGVARFLVSWFGL